MIEIISNNFRTITVRFDEDGNIKLMNTFQKVWANNLSEKIEVILDWSVIRMKKVRVR